MGKILHWIDSIEPLDEMDLKVFSDYNGKIQQLPIVIERLSYNKDFLLAEDAKHDRITADYKNKIIEKCFKIIDLYEIKEISNP